MGYPPNADHCDKCNGIDDYQITTVLPGEKRVGHIHRLETGRGGGVNLCRQCWLDEMTWRMERNKKVATPFDIIPWPRGAAS